MALSENQGRVRASFPLKTGIVALMQKGKGKNGHREPDSRRRAYRLMLLQ